MTPEQLATAKVKGHIIGLVIIIIGVLLTVKTDHFIFVVAAGVTYIAIVAWFVINKGLEIDRVQKERNQTL